MQARFKEITFTDADVINPDDWSGNVGCSGNVPILIHDHGFTVAVVFAGSVDEALDVAADLGKLDAWKVGEPIDDADAERLCYLGNRTEPYDVETLACEVMADVRFSFVALYNAQVG